VGLARRVAAAGCIPLFFRRGWPRCSLGFLRALARPGAGAVHRPGRMKEKGGGAQTARTGSGFLKRRALEMVAEAREAWGGQKKTRRAARRIGSASVSAAHFHREKKLAGRSDESRVQAQPIFLPFSL
jgi:hypothetical protein